LLPAVGTRLPIGCTVGYIPLTTHHSPAVADIVGDAGSFLVRTCASTRRPTLTRIGRARYCDADRRGAREGSV